MNFDFVYTAKTEFGKDDFLRALLLKLGNAKDTPADVVDADFGEIQESYKEIIVCTAFVEGLCTASIGYDRQEPYIDYETYKEKIGDTYVTRQRPVTKYKTVTDWQLFQTPYAGEAVGISPNTEEFVLDTDDIALALTTTRADNILCEGSAVVNETGLSHALTFCKSKVQIDEVNFPGDRRRDVKYNSTATIKQLSCFKLPCYEVTYTYKGKSYTASCFACGQMRIEAQTPPNDVNITAIAKKNTAAEEKTQKMSWLLFTASMIVAAIFCFFVKFPWLFPIPILLLLKAKKDTDTYHKRYQGYSDFYSKDVAQAKASALKKALEKHGFEAPDAASEKAEDLPEVPGAAPLKPIGSRMILCWVLCAILVISSFVTAHNVRQKNLHSPKQVEVAIVEKQVSYDDRYNIHINYKVEAKKLGVEYIDMRVRVKDKNGTELGTITSTLQNLHIDKRGETIVTVTLTERDLESNPFFATLYHTDLSNLEFEFEFHSITFSDNESYYDPDFNLF